MRDLAREAYDNIQVGTIGWMRPDPNRGETLEGFQAVVLAADVMQSDGLIQIRAIHKNQRQVGIKSTQSSS